MKEFKIDYYRQEHRSDFSLTTRELVAKIVSPEGFVPLRTVFFGSAASEEEYRLRLKELKEAVAARRDKICPVVSFIAEPPFEYELAAEVTFVNREIKISPHEGYLLLETSSGRAMITEGICVTGGATIFSKGEEIFSTIRRMMDAAGMKISDIVRQWNYIEFITLEKDNQQNYQQFNEARSVFYNSSGWPQGYPAATGIGTFGGGVVVELNALAPKDGVKVVPIDNKLQVVAHSYSQKVLMGNALQMRQKSTPKFERAKMIAHANGYSLYISGTAAIRGEQSLDEADVLRQATTTFENIEELLSASQLCYAKLFATIPPRLRLLNLRVYVSKPEDYPAVRDYITANYPDIPTLYLHADICRNELLIEIEGLASMKV